MTTPDLTLPGWIRSVEIAGSDHRLLLYSRYGSEPHYEVRFRHRCDRGDRGVIICAPQLTAVNKPGGHQVNWDNGNVTVRPSILCDDCGTHGWITDGRWTSA